MSETAAYGPYRPDPASRLDWGRCASTCRIVALGGLGEVGKNMTVYEYDDSIVVVDAGLAFPRDEHLGVDLVLPDFSYLRENAGQDQGGDPHARPRGPRGLAALPDARGADSRGLGHAAHPRPRQVEARRARPSARCGAPRSAPRRPASRARPVPDLTRSHGALDSRRRRDRHRDARRTGRAHG